jgi:branched-chain amino acid aminotransferase
MTEGLYDADRLDASHQSVWQKGAAYVDGKIVPIAEARIPLLDWGFLRSDACQETISVWRGNFFRLDDHLARFERSLKKLRMSSWPIAIEEIKQTVHALCATTGFENAYIQIIMTRGNPPIGSRDVRLCSNRFYAFCIPYVWIATPEAQKVGISLHLSERVRVPVQSVDPLVKHYHWLDFQMSLLDAYDAGCETVVLVDTNGDIAEGPGFNLFASVGGELITPDSGVLDGMTRRTTLEMCADLQIKVSEAKLSKGQLRNAVEIFLTTTAGGIIPVTILDGKLVGNGAVGSNTRLLREEYWRRREAGWYAEPTICLADLPKLSKTNRSNRHDKGVSTDEQR